MCVQYRCLREDVATKVCDLRPAPQQVPVCVTPESVSQVMWVQLGLYNMQIPGRTLSLSSPPASSARVVPMVPRVPTLPVGGFAMILDRELGLSDRDVLENERQQSDP